MERVIIRVEGRVQGVGFRWWVQHQARELGLAGSAENLPDGRVEVSAQGEHLPVNRMIRRLVEQRVRGLLIRPLLGHRDTGVRRGAMVGT